MFDTSRNVELYRLKAKNFRADISPNQKRYYDEAADWIENNEFESQAELLRRFKDTPFYAGAQEAFLKDQTILAEKAMREAGYDDVADIYAARRAKIEAQGPNYAFTQDYMGEWDAISAKLMEYARRKEAFGKVYLGYMNIITGTQEQTRKEGARNIDSGLDELARLGVSFDELAAAKPYRLLCMATETGMADFAAYIRNYRATGELPGLYVGDIAGEQEEVGRFVADHRQELIACGREETWRRASCVAVPSDAEGGYDFIAMKEVEK